MTFMFFAPAANILALSYTGVALGGEFAFARLVLSLVFGVGIGMIMAVLQARILPPIIGFEHPLMWVIALGAGIALGSGDNLRSGFAADMAGGTTTGPQPLPEQRPTTPAQPTTSAPATAASATPAAAGDARYILQAGSFSASGDAEALKARIALLGLTARVESGEAAGRTVYRVRMGPYGTATDLAEAKQKLGNGGLPALAIKAQ